MPSGPRRSKNAACGLTAAAVASTASRMPRQNSSAARASGRSLRCSGNRAGTGSRPTTSGLSLRRGGGGGGPPPPRGGGGGRKEAGGGGGGARAGVGGRPFFVFFG